MGAFGCTGVWDATMATASLTEVVGPCGALYGQSEF
jgi:hypothetical protein